MSQGNGFTPTHKRMMAVLGDGMPHRLTELHACLNDELQAIDNVHFHLTTLRRIIRPKGQDVICQYFNRRLHYRLVGLLCSADNGKR